MIILLVLVSFVVRANQYYDYEDFDDGYDVDEALDYLFNDDEEAVGDDWIFDGLDDFEEEPVGYREDRREFVPAMGVNHAVGEDWLGFDVEDHVFDPKRGEKVVGDGDPLQAFFKKVEKKYGSISLADVKNSEEDELPLGLEDLLTPSLLREISLANEEEDSKEESKEDSKEDSAEAEKQQLQKIINDAANGKEPEDREAKEAEEQGKKKKAPSAAVVDANDKKLLLAFMKRVLDTCPYNVRVEFVRRFKSRYGNDEMRKIIMETTRKFRDTMQAFVDGKTIVDPQTLLELEEMKKKMADDIDNSEAKKEEEKDRMDDLARDEIKKKLSEF